jgi:ribosomal-protein-alanine N-acetyltransferase
MSQAGLVPDALQEGFLIERMLEHDLLEVVEIEERCGLSLWGWDAYSTELARPESIMLVARRPASYFTGAKRVEGFIAARKNADELHINNIGIREEVRRRGLGRTLLGAALELGAEAGAKDAILEVRAGNLAAQNLYAGVGFKPVGRRPNYYRQPTEDAILMNMRLEIRA